MSIPSLAHAIDFVEALDAQVGQPSHGRELPVILLWDDESGPGHASAFVSGYAGRLTENHDGPYLVPRSVVGPPPPPEERTGSPHPDPSRPDVELLELLVTDWKNTMPRHTGRLRVPAFQVCLDVLDARMPSSDAAESGAGAPRDPHHVMAQALWTAWEQRTPVLGAMGQALGNAALPGWVAGIWTVVLSWPLRVWHRGRLNRRMRWYARRMSSAGLAARDFVQAATRLRTADADQQRLLRMNLLAEALFRDLSEAVGPSRFRPWRRRRTWPFVLLVPDLTGPQATAVEQFLQVHRELVAQGVRPPLLILAGRRGEPADPDAVPALDLERAAATLRNLGSGPTNTPAPRRITVRIADGPEQPDVARHLKLQAKVTPREVSALRAHAGWAGPALALVLLCSVGFACRDQVRAIGSTPATDDRPHTAQAAHDPCPGTRRAGRETVGVDTETEGCYFTSTEDSLLRDLQDRIRSQNAAVEGNHRTVVFLAPLTADPQARTEQLVPAGVLQLQGAVAAQKTWNEQALVNQDKPMLKILVANTGFAFGRGREVARQVRRLAAKDATLSAVIGITQSRQESVDAINDLGPGMPVIGASVTGDFMAQEARNFFHTQPTNERMAEVMARRAIDRHSRKALIIYDREDRYSQELHDDLAGRLRGARISVEDPWFAQVPAPRPGSDGATALGLPDLADSICTLHKEHGTTFYAARGSQLPKVLAEVQNACGGDGTTKSSPVPVVASDVNTLIDFKPVPEWAELYKYPAVNLYYVSFSDKPVLNGPEGGSDYSTGQDSFRAAAAAITRAYAESGGSASPSNVLQALRGHVVVRDGIAPDRPFTLPLDRQERTSRPIFLCLAPHAPTVDSHAHCAPGNRTK
ncbi:ABC transporter substrate-binding protein [Streptomyces pseudovenezuelae]|uniref:ABC transporter substrate-binding protein n=1 Tax=Streptomyces pseudovenezuelae TaxID=67350 RepID=UPI002E3083D2|nr:ABC transporter substrate-binding protein [Streptomyces pseudovenezuelae]